MVAAQLQKLASCCNEDGIREFMRDKANPAIKLKGLPKFHKNCIFIYFQNFMWKVS